MIRKRKLLILTLIILTIFLISTNYLLTKLTTSESKVRNDVSVHNVHDLIYKQFQVLPDYYKKALSVDDDTIVDFIKNINSEVVVNNVTNLWRIANSWVSETRIVDIGSPYLGSVSLALKNSKIIRADLDTRGSQLKLLLTLQGNQDVVFKPKWYDRERIIEGPVYAGKDRYGSEIVAFYLSAILNMPFTPISTERIISLSHDITPVATQRLLNTSFEKDNRTCVYGKCFYCLKQDPVCEDYSLTLPGALIFNIKTIFKNYRSPWQRTYKKGKKAVWEESHDYCKTIKEKFPKKRLLDLIDTSIFDFFIQNGDRHHYQTFNNFVVLLDNGKGFGNPNIHHLDILAPLYQCCMIRGSTIRKLRSLSGGNLIKKLKSMPQIDNLITEAHLKALEERLLLIFATLEYCKSQYK